MTAFIIYILKSTLCLSAFYLLYRLLFRGTTHFRFNRRVLLLGLLVCSLLPLVHFTLEEELPVHRSLRMLDEALTKVTLPQTRQAEVGAVVSADAGESTFLYSRFFFFLYVGGCSFVLLLFLAAYIRMWHLIKSASVYRESGVCWIVTDRQVSPFSWGNYIVMNRKDYEAYPLIRLHEQMHVFYGHSWDSLWMQLLQVFHWFNPVVWLWQKELRDLHEYQADHGVISCGIDVKTYQLLLVEKAVGTRLYSMACGFDHCSLKKRITMMMRNPTKSRARWRALAIVPAVAVALTVVNVPAVAATLRSLGSTDRVEMQAPVTGGKVTQKTDAAQEQPVTGGETMPRYIGGDAKLIQDLCDIMQGVPEGTPEGRTLVKFTVSAEGNITDPEVVRTGGEELDRFVLENITRLGRFTPGTVDGKPVAVTYMLPVVYKLKAD